MRKIYYIADTKERKRLPNRFYKPLSARALCKRLNAEEPGRYQCGDWVNEENFTEKWS